MKKQSPDRKRRCEAQVASGGLYWASKAIILRLCPGPDCILYYLIHTGHRLAVRWLNQWPVGLKWYIFELNLNIIDIWNSGFLNRNFQIWWHPRAITTSTCHEKSLTGNKRWFEISFMEMPETVSRQPSKLRSPAASRVYFSYSWATSSIYLVKSPRELLMEIFSKNKKLTKNKYG